MWLNGKEDKACSDVEPASEGAALNPEPSAMRSNFYQIIGLTAALLVSQAAVADVVRHLQIPESFQGTWALNKDDCGEADKSAANDADAGKPVIVLSPASYVGPQAKCSVLWVVETATPRGPVFSAHLQCPAAATPPTTINLLLSAKGTNEILAGPDFNSLKTYQRCPIRAAAPAP